MAMLEVSHLKKVYTTRFGGNQVEALRNVSFTVEQGEYTAIMGESGSGKTTLLNILAALDKPTGGTVLLDGKDLTQIKESQIAAFRRDNLGFVFQDFNLLDTFSLEDNIYLPLVLTGTPYAEMQRRLAPIAQQLGITELLQKFPYEVSGGQKQRAAVARALITNPLTDPGRRTDRRIGFPFHRRTAVPVFCHSPIRADHRHGDPLHQGGIQRRTCHVHQGRRGVPPAVPGQRYQPAVLPADFRHPYPADDRR